MTVEQFEEIARPYILEAIGDKPLDTVKLAGILQQRTTKLTQIPTVLDFFGIPVPVIMEGKSILDEIRKHDEGFTVDDAFKDAILLDWRTTAESLFGSSLLSICFKKQYEDYKTLVASVGRGWIMRDTQLFPKKDSIPLAERNSTCGFALYEIFEKYVYRERNRCANITRSYQHNLPSLKGMMADDYKLQNYFLFMSVLLLLDKIYVKLFETYLEK